MLDLSEAKWLLQRASAWARFLGISQHLPICQLSSLTERCLMFPVWVPASQLTAAGDHGKPRCNGRVKPKQQKKKDKSIPKEARSFMGWSFRWKDYREVKHRYNKHKDNTRLHSVSTNHTKLLLPLFAPTLQCGNSLAQVTNPHPPLSFHTAEVGPPEALHTGELLKFSIIRECFRGTTFLT